MAGDSSNTGKGDTFNSPTVNVFSPETQAPEVARSREADRILQRYDAGELSFARAYGLLISLNFHETGAHLLLTDELPQGVRAPERKPTPTPAAPLQAMRHVVLGESTGQGPNHVHSLRDFLAAEGVTSLATLSAMSDEGVRALAGKHLAPPRPVPAQELVDRARKFLEQAGPVLVDLGGVGYAGYGVVTDGRSAISGDKLPPFSECPPLVQAGHAAEASAIIGAVVHRLVDLLNVALQADPEAVSALFWNRVTVNNELAEHPHIPIREADGRRTLSVLGLFNGLLNKLLGGTGPRVCARAADTTGEHLSRFEVADYAEMHTSGPHFTVPPASSEPTGQVVVSGA